MIMDYNIYLPLLALFTLVAVMAIGLISKAATERRKADPEAPTSTLAKDGPEGGVDLPEMNRANQP